MSNLKEIKRRIKTIENIEHVTDAIQKIAATQVNKAKNRMLALRNFARAQLEIMKKTIEKGNFIFQPDPDGFNLLIIIASDKGLCGGFNTRIFEKASLFFNENKSQDIRLVLSGKKAYGFYDKKEYKILLRTGVIPTFCILKDVESLAAFVIENIREKKVSGVNMLYTEFQSASRLNPVLKQLFPLASDEKSPFESDTYIFEPDKSKIVEDLFLKYIRTQILLGFEESIASENTARMIMMERATKSAKDMITDLTMERNKNRQALITRELGEIVGTTDALDAK